MSSPRDPLAEAKAALESKSAPAPKVKTPEEKLQETTNVMMQIAANVQMMHALGLRAETPSKDRKNVGCLNDYLPNLQLSHVPGGQLAKALENFKSTSGVNVSDSIKHDFIIAEKMLHSSLYKDLETILQGRPKTGQELQGHFETAKTTLTRLSATASSEDKTFLDAKIAQLKDMQDKVLSQELQAINRTINNQKLNDESIYRNYIVNGNKNITSFRSVDEFDPEMKVELPTSPNVGSVTAARIDALLKEGTFNVLDENNKKKNFILRSDEAGNVTTSPPPQTMDEFKEQIKAQMNFLRECGQNAVKLTWKDGIEVDWQCVNEMIKIAKELGLGIELDKTLTNAMMKLDAHEHKHSITEKVIKGADKLAESAWEKGVSGGLSTPLAVVGAVASLMTKPIKGLYDGIDAVLKYFKPVDPTQIEVLNSIKEANTNLSQEKEKLKEAGAKAIGPEQVINNEKELKKNEQSIKEMINAQAALSDPNFSTKPIAEQLKAIKDAQSIIFNQEVGVATAANFSIEDEGSLKVRLDAIKELEFGTASKVIDARTQIETLPESAEKDGFKNEVTALEDVQTKVNAVVVGVENGVKAETDNRKAAAEVKSDPDLGASSSGPRLGGAT